VSDLAHDTSPTKRIAELERVIGRQQLELVFFHKPCAPWKGKLGKAKHRARRAMYLPCGNVVNMCEKRG